MAQPLGAALSVGHRPGTGRLPPDVPSRGPSRGGPRLPAMAGGAAAASSSSSKIASLDWPPPPSPAHTMSRNLSSFGFGTLGSSMGPQRSAAGLDTMAPGEQKRRSSKVGSCMSDVRSRAELWCLRSDIEHEKLRQVAPFPFLGRPMRFQDPCAALQITDDGRFSYSTMNSDTGETHVVTYEGVIASLESTDPSLEQADLNLKLDPETAAIEGRALVRHEIVETLDGGSRILSVEGGTSRFAILVTPFFQPKEAMVMQLARPRSPGKMVATRWRSLEYVGAGANFKDAAKNGGSSAVRKARCRGPRVVFSKSAAALSSDSARDWDLSASEGADGTRMPFLPKLSPSASAPALATMKAPPAKPGAPQSVEEWKEYYKQRASSLMAGNSN
eukprot:TRINITY_DN26379_c0_g1_i1.p1 TRINITY_DN26379_c0_g1~~TRINITY_DN26379_c0_g1_i1.p1  ORF type:complete len:388 (-),score=85.50 TRINITY_DN26379_c0_g1_i1:260-1423(-)